MSDAARRRSVDPQTVEQTVLDIVRELETELRGSSGCRAITLDASLDRDLGVGSLERVELHLRLERALAF